MGSIRFLVHCLTPGWVTRRILVASVLFACHPDAALAQESPSQSAVEWVKAQAKPLTTVEPGSDFTDLRFLRDKIGAARIVSLGEGTHGDHEFLAFRNRLFEYLVEELGFTAIATETAFADAAKVDDFVMGKPVADSDAARAVFSFVHHPYAENLQLIEWMRAYNARPTTVRKLRFYGHDPQGGTRYHSIDATLDFLAQVDPTQVAGHRQRLEPLLQRQTSSGGYAAMSPEERNDLTATVGDLVSLIERRRVEYISRSSVPAYERAYQNAVNARRVDADYRAGGRSVGSGALMRKNKIRHGNQRDAAMADNVLWALDREGSSGRILVFASNGHVMRKQALALEKNKFAASGVMTALGDHLHALLGNDVFVIGMICSFHESRKRNIQGTEMRIPPLDGRSLNAVLSETAIPIFAFDIHAIPPEGAVRRWWQERRIADFLAKSASSISPRPEPVDLLIYIDTVSSAKVLQ